MGDIRGRGRGSASSAWRGARVDTGDRGSGCRIEGGASAAAAATKTITRITGVPAVEARGASLGIVRGSNARWDHRAGLAGSRTGQVETEGVGAGWKAGEVGGVKAARGWLGTDSPGADAERDRDGARAGVGEEVVQPRASDSAV